MQHIDSQCLVAGAQHLNPALCISTAIVLSQIRLRFGCTCDPCHSVRLIARLRICDKARESLIETEIADDAIGRTYHDADR